MHNVDALVYEIFKLYDYLMADLLQVSEASERCCPVYDAASPANQPWQTIAPASHNCWQT